LESHTATQNASTLPLQLYSWTKASPPLYGSDGRLDEALDHRHQGQLSWHSSFTEQYAQIYGNTGNSYTNTREQTILKLQFLPNDNLAGKSWGGIMRAFPTGLSNHSRKRTLEVVVQGSEGTLNVDLGSVSEDISIPGVNGAEPDGLLQSEVDERSGNFNNEKDAGLDGIKSSEGESGTRWECKPLCYAVPVASDAEDRGLDDWEEPIQGATEQSAKVNGTEGNNAGTGGVAYDTEDINRNGVLDTLSRYLRYAMPLDSACSPRFHCEELRNGWRKYRIPLYGGGVRIDPSNTETEASLLANGQFVRLWIGSLPPRVGRATVQLARVNIEGNSWEEGARNTSYEIDENRFGSGDLGDSLYISVPPSARDSNTLNVGVINRQEERGYFQSPNTPRERDTRTGEPLPERALVLRYENLHPGEAVHATRVLSSDKKDFTRYDRLSLEVHGDSSWANGMSPDQGKVSFGLRLGRDQGNRDSKDYYEIRLHLDTTAEIDPEQKQLWRRNSFSVRLSDLTGLKNDPLYRAFTGREVSRNVAHPGGGDSLTLSVRGSPNLGEIDWMRLVIYADSGGPCATNGRGRVQRPPLPHCRSGVYRL
jgi:cell surface protein SprA